MSKASEISRFESRYSDNIIEVAVVTGASGIGAGKVGKDIMWTVSIDLIAWKELYNNEPIMKEELRIEWLADDEEWQKSRNILESNSIVKLLVRKGLKTMMLVKILETEYKDEELETVLQDAMKPVFYNDEKLGQFELDKCVKLFVKKILWAGEEGNLYFNLDEDRSIMKSALETAYVLLNDQDRWNLNIREYASEKLLESANDWLEDNDEAEINEITKEMFMNFMKLDSISIYPQGYFQILFFDGDMFWGHSIIVNGNINGNLSLAEIVG